MNKKIFTLSIPVIIGVFALFYFTASFIEPAPEKKLVIATGSVEGNYYKSALEYKKLLEENKIEVTLLNTQGSVENIKLLNEGKVDIAFVQNGILKSKNNSLKFLANIYYEPVWIFYKNEGYTVDYIIQLIGKKISTGTKGSGTNDLATKILKDNGIDKSNTQILNHNTSKSKELLLNGQIDAMIMVSSEKSKAVKELLENPDINVLSIKRANAYGQKYDFLEALTLYEGTLDLYKNLPDENINLLSTSANLISTSNVPDELIRLFLKQTKKVHQKESFFSQENYFPNTLNTNLDIHEQSLKYFKNGDTWLESIFPYWIASNIDRLKILLIPLLTLMIPLLKGVLPLYQWSMRSKIYKWYKKINSIDQKIKTSTLNELDNFLDELENLDVEIQKETKVTLAFMGEYYNLFLHIDLVRSKIEKKVNEIQTNS